jgi:hypothetical protein
MSKSREELDGIESRSVGGKEEGGNAGCVTTFYYW